MTSPVTSYVPARFAGFAAPRRTASAVTARTEPRIFFIPSPFLSRTRLPFRREAGGAASPLFSWLLLLRRSLHPVGDRLLPRLGPDVGALEGIAPDGSL